jgi:hypothetical protein
MCWISQRLKYSLRLAHVRWRSRKAVQAQKIPKARSAPTAHQITSNSSSNSSSSKSWVYQDGLAKRLYAA